MPTNEEKQAVWQAYRAGRPTRVPVTYGVNPRTVLCNPEWNTRGITFEEYRRDPALMIEMQLLFLRYQVEFLNQYCDSPAGWPKEFAFYVDNQNTYDSRYFGAPVAFRDGQVADVEPVYAGGGKDRIFQQDIDRPLDNPFIQDCLRRHEALCRLAEKTSFHGVSLKVNPPLMGFDGHLTVAANIRGGDIFCDLYEDPAYVQRFFSFLHQGVVNRTRALHEHFGRKPFDGAKGSFADDSIALISTDLYRQAVLPHHRAWYANWAGGPHSIHLCGDATRHFPLIRDELNVRSFDTGFPVDHGRLREALGPDVEILGGPDVPLLCSGTPAQVHERTREILTSGVMRGGRFVLREGNNLAPNTPEANLAAMYRCCLEHGRYEP